MDYDLINDVLNNFVEIISQVAAPYFHKTYISGHNDAPRKVKPPYYSVECERERQHFLHRLNIYRNTGLDIDRGAMCNARREFKNTARRCRLEYDKMRTNELLNAKHQNTKLYWRLLKGTRQMHTSPNIDAQIVYNHFSSLYTPTYDINEANEEVNIMLENDLDNIYDELNLPFTVDEIVVGIHNSKTGKSPGEDLIVNELLKYGKATLAKPLTQLFNHFHNIGYFPTMWTEGIIIPLHKKGDVLLPIIEASHYLARWANSLRQL